MPPITLNILDNIFLQSLHVMSPITLSILDNIFLHALHVVPPISLNILENIFIYSLLATKSVPDIFILVYIKGIPWPTSSNSASCDIQWKLIGLSTVLLVSIYFYLSSNTLFIKF